MPLRRHGDEFLPSGSGLGERKRIASRTIRRYGLPRQNKEARHCTRVMGCFINFR